MIRSAAAVLLQGGVCRSELKPAGPRSAGNLGDSNEGTRATSQSYLLCQLRVDAVGVSQQKSLKTQSKSLALGGFKDASGGIQSGSLSQLEILKRTSLTDRDLSSVSQAGLVNNLNDGMAWGLFPLVYAAAGLSLSQIGWLAAIYPAVWGAGQLFTGALSDRTGRKWLIASGMWVQAAGIVTVAFCRFFWGFAAGALLLGVVTAMVYPTLLAAIGDVAHPAWRSGAVGVYRLWRDLGYAIGALLAGITADAIGIQAAIGLIAALTFASGLVVAVRMRETKRSILESRVLSSSQSAGMDAFTRE